MPCARLKHSTLQLRLNPMLRGGQVTGRTGNRSAPVTLVKADGTSMMSARCWKARRWYSSGKRRS